MRKLLLFTSLLIVHSFAFSSPGKSLKVYGEAETINVYANELDSPKTKLSYGYFYLNFCRKGQDNLEPPKWNLGETTQWTPYGIWTRINRGCVHLCRREFSQEDVQKFTDLIDRDYRMNFVMDNLPVLMNGTSDIGVLLGFKKDGKYYIHNHLSFKIEINNVTKTVMRQYRVVGFSAAPKSLQTMMIQGRPMGFCENEKSRPIHPEYQEIKPGPIFFSFDIKFFESPKTVIERTEDYKQLGSAEIHWWSLISSCAVNLGLILVIRSLFKKTTQNSSKLNSVQTSLKPIPSSIQVLSLLEGLLPFASIFIELKYLMISFWQHKFYYLYSYLFAALLLLVITSALISIIVTYLNLNNGNQRLSFWNPGSVGLYVFGYAVFFYFNELDLIGFSAKLIYFGYMLALSLILTVLCSVIGFIASSWSIKNIYDSPQALESKQK